MAAELGQQTVEFSSLVSHAAEDSFLSLKELVEKSKASEQSDNDKKISILKYLVKTQQRMLRLNVLAKWCQQVSAPPLAFAISFFVISLSYFLCLLRFFGSMAKLGLRNCASISLALLLSA